MPVTTNTTEIRRQRTAGTRARSELHLFQATKNFLRLGNEIVQYTGIGRMPPYAFTGSAGILETRPAAYPRGSAATISISGAFAFYPARTLRWRMTWPRRLANVRERLRVGDL